MNFTKEEKLCRVKKRIDCLKDMERIYIYILTEPKKTNYNLSSNV